MICRCNKIKILILLLFLFSSLISSAETVRYVTDQFQITLHRSKNLNSEIVTQLDSGTAVKVLQIDAVNGFAKVSTPDQKIGWVLESFLMEQPGGRERYAALKYDYDKLKADFDLEVKKRTEELSTELEKIKRISKRPVELQKENERLQTILREERAQFEATLEENRAFKSIHKDRRWFITGAITALGSLVLGLILTRIPWRKRKSWGEL